MGLGVKLAKEIRTPPLPPAPLPPSSSCLGTETAVIAFREERARARVKKKEVLNIIIFDED